MLNKISKILILSCFAFGLNNANAAINNNYLQFANNDTMVHQADKDKQYKGLKGWFEKRRDRKEKIQALKKELQQERQAVKEIDKKIHAKRQAIKDHRSDRRDDRREFRKDRRDDMKDHRSDRRDNRREFRKDKRTDMKGHRSDRRDYRKDSRTMKQKKHHMSGSSNKGRHMKQNKQSHQKGR